MGAFCLKDEAIWAMPRVFYDYTMACWGVIGKVVAYGGLSLEAREKRKTQERGVGEETNGKTKILGLVDLRCFQGLQLATWPHERREPCFTSHRLLLENICCESHIPRAMSWGCVRMLLFVSLRQSRGVLVVGGGFKNYIMYCFGFVV